MKLNDVIQILDTFNISNEEFHKLIDLKKHLVLMEEGNIKSSDCILTPYYIHENKRLELYEYELNIRNVEKPDFEKYLLGLTGQRSIEDIPQYVIEQQKSCYIELENDTSLLNIDKLNQYIDYIFNNIDLQKQVKNCFNLFNVEEIFFAFY